MSESVPHAWLDFEPDQARRVTCGFLEDYLDDADASKWVLGVSGGLDSAAALGLAVQAVGADRVEGLFLPGPTTQEASRDAAGEVAEAAGIDLREIPIHEATAGLANELPFEAGREVRGNLQARLRMAATYAVAKHEDGLVLGTGNKSELLTGYFTKHGDGGVDVLPIGDLYKTQIRVLAAEIGVPDAVLERPPTAGLWEGQTDENELGVTYDVLDVILAGIEQQFSVEKIVNAAGVDAAEVQRVQGLVRSARHKRNPPAVPKLGWRTVGVDWREAIS